ncbi:hypothetical protein LJC44_07170 [Parabacteroides sp. OttesenSCG-928-G06]|nr:hypothetical protein [Parabacteroides sp. OttesenSCG-928-G06]
MRIVLQTALKANSCAIMLCHNHPSGSTVPSHQDMALTERLKNACKTVGLQLLDHLIITDETYTSFADEGLL